MNESTFNYSYSASENREVERIRSKYIVREESKLERLKRLDRRVANAGLITSLSIGIIGVLIFGIAICIGLDVLMGGMTLAVILGMIGGMIMIPAYPVYRLCRRHAKEKYVPEILRLADEISAGKTEK